MPPQRRSWKRCASHVYIAHFIEHQLHRERCGLRMARFICSGAQACKALAYLCCLRLASSPALTCCCCSSVTKTCYCLASLSLRCASQNAEAAATAAHVSPEWWGRASSRRSDKWRPCCNISSAPD